MPLDPGEEYMSAPNPNNKTDPALKDFFQGIGQAVFGWGKNDPKASTSTQAQAAAPTQGTPANPTQNNSGPVDKNGTPPNGAPLSPTTGAMGEQLSARLPDSTFAVPIPDLNAGPTPGDAQQGGNKDGSYGGGLGKMFAKLFALG